MEEPFDTAYPEAPVPVKQHAANAGIVAKRGGVEDFFKLQLSFRIGAMMQLASPVAEPDASAWSKGQGAEERCFDRKPKIEHLEAPVLEPVHAAPPGTDP